MKKSKVIVKDKGYYFWLGAIITLAILAILVLIFGINKAEAFERQCPRQTPTPTITPTPTETPTPEITPEVTPEVTPEPSSCTGNCGGWSPSPWTPGPYSPPTCNGIYTDKPLLQHFVRVNLTSVELGWWAPVSGVDKYSLTYGYYGQPMEMGVAYIDSNVTNFTINDLQPNQPINAQLWAWRGECVTLSDTIDP